MKKKILCACLVFFLIAFNARAQQVLESYIKQGLENNHALKRKQLSYQESLLSLKEARGLFYPEISFNARYSVAEGGRTIEFPVGDLLNPVYQSLNLLLQTEKFPQINNQEFYFLRPHEQETKLSLLQPILNTEIIYNNKIRQEMTKAAQVDVEAYKRELVATIKTAYYNYLQAEQALLIFDEIIDLLEENIRVNKSLYANEKVTLDVVYRSEAELSKLKKEKAGAVKKVNLARAYFNFLLNRPLESEIESYTGDLAELPGKKLEFFKEHAVSNREDLHNVRYLMQASERNIQRSKGAYYPSLTAAVDYGIQGEEYFFNDDYDFLLASVVLNWKLFSGKRRDLALEKARLDRQVLARKQLEAEQKVRMEVMQAYYALLASSEAVEAASDEYESANRAFGIVHKRYGQGQASLLEFLDANTSLKKAKIGKSIAKYQFMADYAQFEKAAAISKTDY